MRKPKTNVHHPETDIPLFLHVIARTKDVAAHDVLVEKSTTTGHDITYTFKKTGKWTYQPISETLAQVHKISLKTQKLVKTLRSYGIDTHVCVG